MQRWKTAVLMMLLCLSLSACGGTENRMQEALQFRTDLLASAGCEFEAELTAQGETEVYTCTLQCVLTPEGVAEVTVLAPEEIAGVTATVSSDGAKVSYDGVQVDFGALSSSVTPVGTPGLLYAAWTGGYISTAGVDSDATLARYLLGSGSAERQVDTWFSADGTPSACEVIEDGTVVIQCQLRNFHMGDNSTKVSTNPAPSEGQ